MIDLISKVDDLIKSNINIIQKNIDKYILLLNETLPEKNIPYLAYIFNICVDYLNGSHGASNANEKAWAVFVVRNQFIIGNLKTDNDVIIIIDDFINYWKINYENYCENIIAITEYDRDRGFVGRFEKNYEKI